MTWWFSQTLLNKETAEENIFTTNRRDDHGDQNKIQTAVYWPKCPISQNTQCLKHYHCSPCCVQTLINWDSSTPKSKQCSVDWGGFCSKSLGWWFCSVWLSVETVTDRAVKSGGTQVDCTHSFIQTSVWFTSTDSTVQPNTIIWLDIRGKCGLKVEKSLHCMTVWAFIVV